MTKYAAKTQVSSEKSKQEIERILTRYGATEFLYGTRSDCAVIAFKMVERNVRFLLPLPDRRSKEFTEYMRRQKWRALALVIKAKLEAVESGITEFEDEFLAHIVLPSGQTMGQLAKPQIQIAYETGEVPALLSYDPVS